MLFSFFFFPFFLWNGLARTPSNVSRSVPICFVMLSNTAKVQVKFYSCEALVKTLLPLIENQAESRVEEFKENRRQAVLEDFGHERTTILLKKIFTLFENG